MPDIQEARPPYVQFEVRGVEDRTTQIAEGRYATKDVIFAVITPAGSRDKFEKVAVDWLSDMAQQVQQERLPVQWLEHYRRLFEAFKTGQELPENGTSIREWPPLSPAQVKMLLDLRIRTVEDLAAANEEAISRLGMGGRNLKQKAIDWLAAASGIGKGVEAAAALRVENEQLKLTLERVQAELQALERRVIALSGAPEEASDSDDFEVVVAPPQARKL